MGFFSSRRAEHLEGNLPDGQGSVSFRAIRARFYGNGKGKGKECDLDGGSVTSSTAASPSFSSPHTLSEKRSFVSARVHELRGLDKDSRRVASSTSPSLAHHRETTGEQNGAGTRTSTDAVTITLAQRLNELATANSEGLLSDDEYRLLRQNLFERFASNSQVPAETPVVPMSGGGHGAGGSRMSISSIHDRRPSSQFYVQSSRASSVQSKHSLTSTIGGLLRRATSRRVVSSPSDLGHSDAVSIFSTGSTPDRSRTNPHPLTSRTSESSFSGGLERSRSQQFRPTPSPLDVSSPTRTSRGKKRSGSSAPPSAFPSSSHTSVLEPASPVISGESMQSDDEVESVNDIRRHIELVEAEGRRLLDAFNGLELSTLTRRHKRPQLRPLIPLTPGADTSSINTNDARSLHTTGDVDAVSFKSGGSGARTPSVRRRSPHRRMHTSTSSTTLISQPPKPISRKGSISSISSRGRTGLGSFSGLSPHYGLASSSSLNLSRSSHHLPLATVAETEATRGGHRRSITEKSRWTSTTLGSDIPPLPCLPSKSSVHTEDEDIRTMEVELTDIRRRRAEVTARYEARLEYLRARLKGAELREKVMRK